MSVEKTQKVVDLRKSDCPPLTINYFSKLLQKLCLSGTLLVIEMCCYWAIA